MKTKFKKNIHYLIPPLVVALTFILIMIIKGVYPFGDNVISGGDFDVGYVPVYYKLYDVLHGTGTILFDFNIGGGSNIYGSLVLNALLSPISWLIYFSSRSNIMYFLSLIYLIKLMVVSLTAYYSFNYFFKKVDRFYKILFSVIYAIGGYMLIVWANFMWFESIALFPLIVVGLKQIFDNKKSLLFVISLTLSLIFSYYISYMILFFLLIASLLGLIIYDVKDKKIIATKILIYILFSLFISMFAFLPSFMQSMNSYRMSSETNIVAYSYLKEKIAHFLGYAFIFIVFLKQIFNYKKDKKYSLFYALLFIFCSIGLIIEPINKLWHTGSYSNIPFRYGFIPVFIMLLGGLHYINKNGLKPILKGIKSKIAIILYIFLNIILFYIIFSSKYLVAKGDTIYIINIKVLIILLIIFVINIVIYMVALSANKKARKVFLCFSVLIEILFFAYSYIVPAPSRFSEKIDETNFPERQLVYRYKDNTTKLGLNFSYQSHLPSIANWIHIITKEQFLFQHNLGYYNYSLLQYSTGGTIFSDLIIGNKYILTYNDLSDKLYNFDKQDDNYNYYSMKYNLSFAIPYSGNIYNDLEMEGFEYQNKVYQTLFNKDDTIIDIESIEPNISIVLEEDREEGDEELENYYIYEYNINNTSLKNYYLDYNLNDSFIYKIVVNNDLIYVPRNNFKNNTFLNSEYHQIVDLGTYENEPIKIQIYAVRADKSDFEIGSIDINKFISLTEENDANIDIEYKKNKMYISYDNTNNMKSLLIPINYTDSLEVINNNKNISYERNLGNYMSINIEEGENNIELIFTPPYLKLGIIISIVSLIIFIIFSIINLKYNIASNIIIKNIFFYLFILIEILFVLKVYILSLF